MSFRRLLILTAYFVMNAQGKASSRLARETGTSPITAFVAGHKMREAIAFADEGVTLEGTVEIDGCVIGGHVKKANSYAYRRMLGKQKNQDKVAVICVARARRGRVLTKVVRHEKDFVEFVRKRVAPTAEIHSDEASHWERVGETHTVRTINHSQRYWSKSASTNGAESHFARVRRGERGVYLKIADIHRDLYAAEQAWRTTNCRLSDAERYLQLLRLCLTHPVSRRFKSYGKRKRSR